MNETALAAKLKAELDAEYVEVHDDSDGCGAKFNAIIVSAKFEGMMLLQRQRAVNAVLQEEMQTIHALTMKTWTPAQAQQKLDDYDARKAAAEAAAQ